jgi:hypothetical protein
VASRAISRLPYLALPQSRLVRDASLSVMHLAFMSIARRKQAQGLLAWESNRKTRPLWVNWLPAPFASLPCCQCDPRPALPVFTFPQGPALCRAKPR